MRLGVFLQRLKTTGFRFMLHTDQEPDDRFEYRVVWLGADGIRRAMTGTWPSQDMAVDMANRSIRELIGWSTKFEVIKEPKGSKVGLLLDGTPWR